MPVSPVALRSAHQRERTHCATFFTSASFVVFSVGCTWSLPSIFTLGLVVRCVTSFCSASALPLYLAATLLYDGPSFCLSIEWQLRQPLFFTRPSAAASSAASAISAP